MTLLHGDALSVLPTLAENSIDAIVTDPPAGIAFMAKSWDTDHGGRDAWIANMMLIATEALRVAKPGAHALVWALPRTSHWTATAWENAGWEVRDRVGFLFGSGFPKSLDVEKAIWKEADKTRSIPLLEQAETWRGWGTALKPAVEDWWLLRKPLGESTVAANVLRHGTGALNVDGCRIPAEPWTRRGLSDDIRGGSFAAGKAKRIDLGTRIGKSSGRFPAHLTHDGSAEVLAVFPAAGNSWKKNYGEQDYKGRQYKGGTFGGGGYLGGSTYADSGSAARFFYCAKASRSEREAGLEGMDERNAAKMDGGEYRRSGEISGKGTDHTQLMSRNHHPTVKPLALMRYLVRLITPTGGTVLDCFMGSGSTGVACVRENVNFIGIEREADYYEIAKKRIESAAGLFAQPAAGKGEE